MSFLCKGESSMRIQVVLMIALLSLFAAAAVAADIGGKWTSETPGRDGTPQVTTYNFKVSGTTLTGTVATTRGDQEISEGKINGDEVSFVTVREGQNGTMKTSFKGKVVGAEIHLTREMVMPAGMGGPGGGGGGRGGRGGPAQIVLKRAS
jgi:hypothetical protein